jgi:hypothetical protein
MSEVETVTETQLSLVSALVKELVEVDALIASAESELKALSERKQSIEQKRLPDAMADVGFDELKLSDGSRITIKPEYYASIAGAKKAPALNWLKDNGFGDVIKTELKIVFNKGENSEAMELFTNIAEDYPDNKMELAEAVHASTLKSLVKEQFESGSPMPEDLFGVYIINRAVVKK